MAHRWYVVHVYSGFEGKVAESLNEQIEKHEMQEKITDVMVPSHEVTEVRRGKKVSAQKKYFPGYVLVRMELDDAAWHLVKDTPKVTGFLGGRGKPSPISNAEAERLMQQLEEGVAPGVDGISFEIGEQVRVCDGPFSSFNGVVEEVDADKSRLKVMVSIFGRSTPVDLDYAQVEKV